MNDNSVTAIIPARLGSSRLPGKPLADICGRPMILRVVERVTRITCLRNAAVATDSREIMECVKGAGYRAVLTAVDHPSGTDRIAEAAMILGLKSRDIVVNVQGDQPLIETDAVEAVVRAFESRKDCSMSTVACPMTMEEAGDPNRVKVVTDFSGRAIFFSRSMIPFDRDGVLQDKEMPYLRHLGLYAYRMDFLQKFVKMPVGRLEAIEKLEQLRVIENGFEIAVQVVEEAPIDVDTEKDLEEVRMLFKAQLPA